MLALPSGSPSLLQSVSPFSQLVVHLHPRTVPFLLPCPSSSNTCQLHWSPPEEEQAHAGMLPRPFQWPSPNGAGAFVPRAFLNRFWGNQQGGIRLPIEGGVALARCLLGVIMDHTWSCSSSSPRPGPWVRGHRPSSPSNRPMKRSSSQPFCLGPLSLSPSLPWPFVLLSGGPVPQHPLPQLCSRHLQYATNKYSRNAMNAGLSVSVNVPK